MAEAPYALVSLIDNDQRLYRMRQYADKQLALKKARGVYDRERAGTAYTGLVELLAKEEEKARAEYEERTPRPWHVAWSKAERVATERELVARFENAWASPKSEEHKELLASLPKKFQGGKHVAGSSQLGEKDLRARRRHGYTLAELRRMPVISEGYGENLVVDTGLTRVWLSRVTKEDGAKHDNAVTVETRPAKPGSGPLWKTLIEYEPKRGARSSGASATKHESGGNPKVTRYRRKPHKLDAAALARIERAAANRPSDMSEGLARQRAKRLEEVTRFKSPSRSKDAALKARVSKLLGKK